MTRARRHGRRPHGPSVFWGHLAARSAGPWLLVGGAGGVAERLLDRLIDDAPLAAAVVDAAAAKPRGRAASRLAHRYGDYERFVASGELLALVERRGDAGLVFLDVLRAPGPRPLRALRRAGVQHVLWWHDGAFEELDPATQTVRGAVRRSREAAAGLARRAAAAAAPWLGGAVDAVRAVGRVAAALATVARSTAAAARASAGGVARQVGDVPAGLSRGARASTRAGLRRSAALLDASLGSPWRRLRDLARRGFGRLDDWFATPGLRAEVALAVAEDFAADERPDLAERPSLSVVHYIGQLGPGGAERQLCNLAVGLARRGHRVSLWCSNLDDARDGWTRYADLARAGGVPPESVGPGGPPPPADAPLHLDRSLLERLPRYLAPYVRPLALRLAAERPDVLHCWLDHTNLYGGLAGLLAGVPRIVLSTRSVAPLRFPHLLAPWMRPWYRVLARSPRVVLLNNSLAGARDYAAWLGVAPERFLVVRNGLDLGSLPRPEPAAARRSLGLPEGAPVLGGVFRFSREKRPFDFLEVAARVRREVPGLRVVVAGAGVLFDRAAGRVRELGLSSVVQLLGLRDDPATVMAAADVFLQCSEWEGTSNTLLEAQNLGVPVVATRRGGTPEAVREGETALLTEAGDVGGMARAVVRLLREPATRERLGAAGRAFVAEAYGLEALVAATERLYYAPARPPGGLRTDGDAPVDGPAPGAGPARFAFGRNWASFVRRRFSEERAEDSRLALLQFLGREDLRGSSFLDVGCGSGLHSLAAHRAGARRVVSFDLDPESVATTASLHRLEGSPASWSVLEGSALDQPFLATLEPADVVYSWGVLHHTGAMWEAIDRTAGLVAPGGLLFLALYDPTDMVPSAAYWKGVKRRYGQASWLGRRALEAWYLWRWVAEPARRSGRSALLALAGRTQGRGMALYTDVVDWLGGWPFEYATPAEVAAFFARRGGFELLRTCTGKANAEYLLRRTT